MTTKTTKTTKYGVYRVGANAANQGGRERLLVAVVEASNRAEAEATERAGSTVYDSSFAVLAPDVDVWANQRLVAVPFSRVSAADVREFNERAGF